MTSGYILITRDRDTSGIYVETADDWMDVLEEYDRRVLYCQAVSDKDVVQEKLDRWLEENEISLQEDIPDMNSQIAELISSIQWIANEHPLQCFHNCSGVSQII